MGRNRVVRRMFAALGYEVVKLDRVVFAGLTKKDLPRKASGGTSPRRGAVLEQAEVRGAAILMSLRKLP